jgi:hypothetical protein
LKHLCRPLTWTATGLCLLVAACIGPTLMLGPATLTNAIEGQTYSVTLEAEGAGNARWSVVGGGLPPGLTLATQSGAISGVPTTPGDYSFTAQATVTGIPQRSGEQGYTLTVIERLRLDDDLPPARAETAYSGQLGITGGVPPYTIAIVGLPAGMQFDATTGAITGTPPFESADQDLLVTIEDSGTPQQVITQREIHWEIRPVGVSISTTELPTAPLNEAYSFRVSAAGGRQPYSWAVVAGVLPGSASDPDPFRIDPASGTITGTPTATTRTSTFTLEVEDSDAPSSMDTRQFKLVVPVQIVTTALPGGVVGNEYEAAIGAGGGLPGFTWSLAAGDPPAGITLDAATGVLSGTPTSSGTATFTVRVTDSDESATVDEREFTLEIVN